MRLNGFYTHTLKKRLFPGKRNLPSEILQKNVFTWGGRHIYFFFRVVDAILNLSMYKISYVVQVYTYASHL